MNHIKSLISAVFVVFLLASCNNSSPQQNSQAPSDSTSEDTAKTESSKRILFFGNSLTLD